MKKISTYLFTLLAVLGFSAPAMATDYPVSGQGSVYVSNDDYSVDEYETFSYTQTDAETFVIANFLNSGVDVTFKANFNNGSVSLQGGMTSGGYWYLTDADGNYPNISCGSYNGSFFSTYIGSDYTYAGYYDGWGYYVNFSGWFGNGDDDWFYATFYFDDYTPDSGNTDPTGDKYAMPAGFEGNYYARALSQSDIEAGQTYIIYNPYGWVLSDPYFFDEDNAETTWGHYPANKAVNIDDRVANAYYGEVNTPNKPYEILLEDAGNGQFYLKDNATGKYLYGYYGNFNGTARYAMGESEDKTVGEPWIIEYSDDYPNEKFGDFYVYTKVNGTDAYLTIATTTSANLNRGAENWSVRTANFYTLGMLRKTNTDENWKGSEPVFEVVPEQADYKKVLTADDLQAGDKILVTNSNGWVLGDYSEYGGSCPAVNVTLGNDNTTYSGWVNGEGNPFELTLEDAGNGKYYLVMPNGKYLYAYNWQGEYEGENYDTYYLECSNSPYGEWNITVENGVADLTLSIPAIDANYVANWDEMRTVHLTIISFNDDGVISNEYTARNESNHTLAILRKLRDGELLQAVITPQEVAGIYSLEYTDYDYYTQTTTLEINIDAQGKLYMTGLFDEDKVQRIPVKLTDNGTISISAYTNGDYEVCPADGSAVFFNAKLTGKEPVTFKDTSDEAYNYGFAVIYGASNYEYLYGDFTLTRTGDVLTAIKTLNAQSDNNVFYNIAGQRVSKDAKGIIITNGRKVVK